jgi:DNA-binding response OmpR family regulator
MMTMHPIFPNYDGRYVAMEHGPSRVIVADDDDELRTLVAFALERRGFDVVQASDGAEALASIGLGPSSSDEIVVADVRMPDLSGLELLSALRLPPSPTRVVLMTAFPDFDTRARASELGVDAFFAKPFDIEELVSAVVGLTAPPIGTRE